MKKNKDFPEIYGIYKKIRSGDKLNFIGPGTSSFGGSESINIDLSPLLKMIPH